MIGTCISARSSGESAVVFYAPLRAFKQAPDRDSARTQMLSEDVNLHYTCRSRNCQSAPAPYVSEGPGKEFRKHALGGWPMMK
eukprot:6208175-Pleurochrysis_carterae.AAC.1